VLNDYICGNGLCRRDDLPLVEGNLIDRDLAAALCAGAAPRGDYPDVQEGYCASDNLEDPCPLPLPDACLQP
jgi:hypothetical protein